LDWCRLDRCRLDGLCWSLAPLSSLTSLAPLATLASLARPSWCWLLWHLGLLPLASLLGPTWLATWKTSRLAAWETTLDRSWKATRILGPLIVGLAEGQRAARGPAKDLLASGGRGQWLGGGREHASKG